MIKRIVMAGAVVAFFASAAPLSAQQNSSETYQQLNLFGDVFERVRSDYVDKVSDEDLIEAAISGMLTSLDPHSSYLSPKNYREMQVQTKGEFGGLGIEVTMENGYIKVVSPIDDTPASRAGLKPGDLITSLDGEPVQGLTLSQAVEKMRGPVGSDLKLGIRREGKDPFTVTVTRAVIKIRSVRSRMLGKDIAYIRITSFSEQTSEGVHKAMTRLTKEAGKTKLRGLILDLRNNPGGLLDQSVQVADAFIDKGEIVSTRSRRPEEDQRFNAKPGDIAHGLPMVVLINGGSASASEIVSGALQDHHRAILMGTRSFGKGSVQTIIPLAGHGAIRLTTARYYTPSGRSIQAKGIIPDITVEQATLEAVDHAQRRREENLRGRLDNPTDPKANDAAKQGKEEAAEADDDTATKGDYQLTRAVDLIRGISLYEKRAAN